MNEHEPRLAARRVPTWRRASLVAGLVLAVVALAAGFALNGRSEPSSTGQSAGESVIQQFPISERAGMTDFEGRLLDGSDFSSANLDGRVVVYNVWGSWCGPCRAEAPALVRTARRFEDEVSFVGINVRDGLDSARAFERAYDVPYPSLRASDSGEALLAFGGAVATAAVPTTVVVDDQGRVAARVVGPTSFATLGALLEDALAESVAQKS